MIADGRRHFQGSGAPGPLTSWHCEDRSQRVRRGSQVENTFLENAKIYSPS